MRQNVEIVVKQFENTNARDFVAVMDAYTEDVTLILHGEGLLTGGATGKADVGKWFGDWFAQFGRDYRFEIEESQASGDRVFLVATHHGRGRTSGAPVGLSLAYVYTVLGGKVSRVEVWSDREAALEAAGL
jgi:ketosteroid isomerase-like protein